MERYPWYEVQNANAALAQGDIFYSCPVIVPPLELIPNQRVEVEVDTYDVIVMSQSCDLEQAKLLIGA